jgi:hypothetical protein
MNPRKLLKYSSIYRECALHISDRILQEGNELADIVIQKFRALPEGMPVDSFMFKDLEITLSQGPYKASCGNGQMFLSFDKNIDDRTIRSTVIHEYTHHTQYDKGHLYLNLYKFVENIANGWDDVVILEDAINVSTYLKSEFPKESYFQDLVDQMSTSARSGNVDETRRLAAEIFLILHNNSPHEVEAIRHQTYQSFKSHLESDKVVNNIKRYGITSIREYFNLLIKHAESLVLRKLFPFNQKKLLIAMWGLIQEYKPKLYGLGLTD